MFEHHTPSKKKQFKKKSRRDDNDNWRNRQIAKDKKYNRSKERFNEVR